MNKQKILNPLPSLESEEVAERFVEDADLTDYDLSAGRKLSFEVERKASEKQKRGLRHE